MINRTTEIKAMLYDLQYHNCNGFAAMRWDDPLYALNHCKSCDFYTEITKLKAELVTLDEKVECGYLSREIFSKTIEDIKNGNLKL